MPPTSPHRALAPGGPVRGLDESVIYASGTDTCPEVSRQRSRICPPLTLQTFPVGPWDPSGTVPTTHCPPRKRVQTRPHPGQAGLWRRPKARTDLVGGGGSGRVPFHGRRGGAPRALREPRGHLRKGILARRLHRRGPIPDQGVPADPGGLPTAQHGALVPTKCLETRRQPHAPSLQVPVPSASLWEPAL